jgi:hypothetical protein
VRETFASLAGEAGAADPQTVARQLVLLYDGASVSARMDHDVDAAKLARATGEMLLDAAIAAGRSTGGD